MTRARRRLTGSHLYLNALSRPHNIGFDTSQYAKEFKMQSHVKDRCRVLLLSTYPLVEPRHGGQVRLLNIKRAYAAAGWDVVTLAVYDEQVYSPSSAAPHDVPFPASSPYRNVRGQPVSLASDLLSGDYASAIDGGLHTILGRTPEAIDCIHVEQPWLWPVAELLRRRRGNERVVTVYGSQNIEAPLKQENFKLLGLQFDEHLVARVAQLEVRAAREADIVLAVSQQDADEIIKWGPKRLLLAPNGVEPWPSPSQELRAQWLERLPKHPWLLYVASAHPPNFSNFATLFGGSLACVPPTSRIVVAGGVSEHLYRIMRETEWWGLNLSRLELLFTLSEEQLAAVKSLTHGFLLPISSGGGTNIKTAEALYSGAHVVATPAAFRGYEEYLGLPEVHICSSPKELQKAVRSVLSLPRASQVDQTSAAAGIRHDLTWSKRLASLPEAITRLITAEQKNGPHLV